MPNRFSKVDAQQVPLLGGNAKMASDPKRNQTVLHLSTLGAIRGEQNNTFVDDSPNRFAITRTGNVAPSTFSPYGDSWSNYFDGSGDYLSTGATSLSLAPNNFTVEAWIYPQAWPLNTNASNSVACIVSKQTEYLLYYSPTGAVTFAYINSGLTAYNYYGTGNTIALQTWNHIAVCKSGSTLKIFINGVESLSTTWTSTTGTTSNPVTIGRNMEGGFAYETNGYISNLRIVNGTALYTANFTPSKTPLTAVSGTSLLTCASNRFQDKSSNNFTITPAGNVAVKTASPFPQTREFKKPQRGWCVPFNGSTQRLETQAASSGNGLQLGTSDFTIECWVKAKPQTGYATIMSSCVYGNPNYAWGFGSNSAGTTHEAVFTIYTGTGSNGISTGVVIPNAFNNAWNHLAIVRVSTGLYAYLNGELISTSSIPSGAQNMAYTTPITIGVTRSASAATYSNYFSGKISNVMIVKKALYSGNFVPMQSPRTADQNGTLPVLLTCQGGTVMDYSYSSQTLTSAGSLVVDSDGPFDQDDELSYYFDGNGDYLSIADNAALEIGSGDFTIECWFNSAVAAKAQANSDSTYSIVIAEKPSSYSWVINGTSSSLVGFYLGISNGSTWQSVGADYSFQANTWYHVAVSKQSGTMRLFVNGKLLNSGTITHTAANNANALLIGINGVLGTNYAFNGYISNLRLVTGAALYTASFTPSRKPLGIASSGSTALLTCMGRTVSDQSANALPVNGLGNAAYPISEPSPFRQFDTLRTSCYFDGNNDYLQIADNANLKIYNSDFTIEAWVYPRAMPTNIDTNTNSACIVTKQVEYLLYYASDGNLGFSHRTSAGTGWNNYASTGYVKLGMWNHVAVCRLGTSMRMFLNGSQVYSGTWVTTTRTTTNPVTIGRGMDTGYSYYLNAYVAGFKISKYCLYGGSYTPGYLLNDYGNQLLINAYPAIYDTTRKNAIETVGPSSAANVGTPWGKKAERYGHYFNGSSDYLNIPFSPDLNFGTGDFTIETWVLIMGNSSADGSGNRVAVLYSSQVSGGGPEFTFSISGNASTTGTGIAMAYYNGTSYTLNTNAVTSISQNIWHHVAITRSGTTLRIFLDGAQVATTTDSSNIVTSADYRIGMWNHPTAVWQRYFNGALHDFRVTKGIARYTSNFTMPLLHPIK